MTLSLLNTVVDSLDIRISRIATPSEWLSSQLQAWRLYQQNFEFGSDPYMVELPALGSFRLKSVGSRPYEFILINPEICDIRVWNPDKWESAVTSQTGQLHISFRSRFLQVAGLDAARTFLETLENVIFATRSGGFRRVSRGDLAADLQLDEGFFWQDLPNFVSRSRFRDVASESGPSIVSRAKTILSNTPPQPDNKGGATYISAGDLEVLRLALNSVDVGNEAHLYRVCHNRQPQTLYFGRFASPLYARIYDKSASLDKQNKDYMREIWAAAGWGNDLPVWRFEFSCSGDFLKGAADLLNSDANGEIQHDLREFEDFVEAIPRIWQYLTVDWLRYTLPAPGDKNLWRAPLHPLWQLLQTAWPSPVPIIRVRPPRKLDDEQLTAQLKGVALTIAAKRSSADSPDTGTYSIVLQDLWEYFESSSFDYELLQRRRLLGIDDISDTNYSAQIRAERILEGNGS